MGDLVWIETLHNLHCPTCDARLVAPAGRFQGLDGPEGFPPPTYVEDGNKKPVCPAGHDLPDLDAVDAYSREQGHEPPPQGSPVREVDPPR